MASRFEEDGERKQTIADKLAPKGKSKYTGRAPNPRFDPRFDTRPYDFRPSHRDFTEPKRSNPEDEYPRPELQLVMVGVGSNNRREVIPPGTWIKARNNARYRFLEVVKVDPPADQLPINDTPDSHALYNLRVNGEWTDKVALLPLSDLPGFTVQVNPLHPYTFYARVLPALTKYHQVKTSGLGVDRWAQLLYDAVMFLIDERNMVEEEHRALQDSLDEKLRRLEESIRLLIPQPTPKEGE